MGNILFRSIFTTILGGAIFLYGNRLHKNAEWSRNLIKIPNVFKEWAGNRSFDGAGFSFQLIGLFIISYVFIILGVISHEGWKGIALPALFIGHILILLLVPWKNKEKKQLENDEINLNSETIKKDFSSLIEAIKLLAAGFDIQRDSIPDNRKLSDELILEFESRYSFVGLFHRKKLLNDIQYMHLIEIEKNLLSIADDKELWSDEAVKGNESWERVRDIARETLISLNIE